MKILMVTPHLPPYQAANALLPHQLGAALERQGHGVRFLTFGDDGDTPEVAYVRRYPRFRATRLPQALEALETWRKTAPLAREADVVHIHSNTWMNQVAARATRWADRPYLLTHYGTEIWHHDGKDRAFRLLNARAAHVTFYSQALYDRGRELGVPLRHASVVYPPVADAFQPKDAAAREAVRRRVAPDAGLLLLNVKRLHPLADQATLLEAFALVLRARPDARLLVAGSGECEAELRASLGRLGLEGKARLLGLVPNEQVAELQAAADLFVLSSLLEATPTVALEALACGTPVVSTDNPGGSELGGLFGEDVAVVPKRDPRALAGAIIAGAAARRRVRPETAALVAERFRLPGVTASYLALYQEALAA
jgi:glycosyltransferase involved in cell wall biosynthesis